MITCVDFLYISLIETGMETVISHKSMGLRTKQHRNQVTIWSVSKFHLHVKI